MRTMSLFFVPALALTYFAGTQYAHNWSFALLGGAVAFLYLLIAQFYKIALNEPEGISGVTASEVSIRFLQSTLSESQLDPSWPVYVATDMSGIVPAHNLYTARFDGRKVLIVGSDAKTDKPRLDTPGTDLAF